MKKIFLSAFLLTAYAAQAQDLTYKIPKDALAVASVKGDKLLDLMSISEFNNTFIGKELLEEFNTRGNRQKNNSIEDFGIQLNGTVYYFNQQTDSISYNCLLIPIADVQKFENIFRKRDKDKIERKGDYRRLYQERDNALLQWNNEYAYLVFGSLKDNFLEEDSVMAARYGLKKVNYSDYYYNNESAEEAAAAYPDDAATTVTEEVYDIGPTVVDSAVTITEDEPGPVAVMAYEDIPKDAPAPPVVDIQAADVADAASVAEEAIVAEEPPVAYDAPIIAAPPTVVTVDDEPVAVAEPSESYRHNSNAYDRDYNEQRRIKTELTSTWVNGFATNGFQKTDIHNSILENPAYQRSLDPNAAATFYLSGVQSLYTGFLPYVSHRYLGLSNIMEGYGSINAKLFLNKENMRITSEMEVDDKKAAAYKKMYQHKPNKKFAKYINSDKMVGFMSYSFDTEEYLKAFPQLLNEGYGRYFGLYSDEIGIGAELLSLLLDEKAVAKVVKGDAVLLLNDIGPKEYTYTTYDYDEDYQRTEVKKKKTETLPDFLFMMSSDDTHLIERLLHYGIKKEKIVLKNGIYTLDNKITRGNPFSVHILIKDGIVFCGTSYRDIQQISTDSYQGNMSKDQKNLLLKSNMSVFFNPKNIVGKITDKEFGSSRKLTDFNTLLGNTGVLYGKTTGIKNNRISGEMVAEVPEGKENALKYFFSLIDQASKLD